MFGETVATSSETGCSFKAHGMSCPGQLTLLGPLFFVVCLPVEP